MVRLTNLWVCGESPNSLQQEAEVIARIGESGEPAVLLTLAGYVYWRTDELAKSAADAIEKILDGCAAEELAELDYVVRHKSDWRMPSTNVKDVAAVAWGRANVIGLLSFDSSGYVREAAVRALAASQGGNELPFLIIRLNDWVEAVREVARSALLERMKPELASRFVRCLPLIYRLVKQSRAPHQGVFDRIIDLLRKKECAEALRAGIRQKDRTTRRLAFRLLMSSHGFSETVLLDDALAREDTVIRLWAAQELRSKVSDENLRGVLERMWQDRFVPVRLEALYGFAERLPGVAEKRLREALADRHAAIREAARFYLRKIGETDFASFYRSKLMESGGNRLAVIIAGLGETGVAADAQLVATFLSHREGPVRRAAVVAVGRLDAENFVEVLLVTLGDERPSVAKAAREVLLRQLPLVAPTQLWTIFESTDRPHVRSLALSLIAELRWWQRTPLLVRALNWDDEEIVAKAKEYLRGNRNENILIARPAREEVEALELLLEKRRQDGKQPVLGELEEMVAYVRREMFPPRWR